MKYIIINTNQYNGHRIGQISFYAAPIFSGEHKGKFATSENALKEFTEIFENEEYEIAELDSSVFIMTEKEQLLIEKEQILKRLNELENE